MGCIVAAATDEAALRRVAPADVEAAIGDALARRWGPVRRHPELIGLLYEGEPSAWCDIRLTIQLDEDLELPFEIEDAEILEMLHGDAGGFGDALAEICEGLRRHATALRGSQDAMRARCEAFARSLGNDGLELPLAWISLAPHDHWIEPDAVRFDIALEGLGNDLQPSDVLGEAGLDDDLHEAFAHALGAQRNRARLRAEIQAQGADGLADAIALAVIRSQPDPVATLSAAMNEDRIELPDRSSLYWSDGVLRSRGDCAGNAEWWRDQIELPGRWYSGPTVKALVGGPAAAIIEHPALAEIGVRAIHSDIVDGRPSTMVELDAGIELFEAATCRSWPRPNPDGG